MSDELRAVREVNRTLMRQSLIDQQLLEEARAEARELRVEVTMLADQVDMLNRQAGGYKEPTR